MSRAFLFLLYLTVLQLHSLCKMLVLYNSCIIIIIKVTAGAD
ncbi:unnamed protein product [Staurois parvus]|uniref:Uncharacterized protein n=1 Tax=Staurois parvus TaxID=386267 RepID=A0ABN9DEN8_9NEOB|nr:unnamed protein product [Staurois parvus]